MLEGVFKPMLKKWRLWLPLLATLWFWGLIYHEHQINDQLYGKGPRLTEHFGCSSLYHNPEDRRPNFSESPYTDCWEPFRFKLFVLPNFVPILFSAAILDRGDYYHWDEIIVAFVSLSSSLIIFWWVVGSFVDRRIHKLHRAT